MNDSQTSFYSFNVDANNSADKIPTFNQSFGGRHVAQALITAPTGVLATATGINCNLVNRWNGAIECNIGCNASNPSSLRLAPLQCATLQNQINDQSVTLRLRSEVPHLSRKEVDQTRIPFFDLLCHELLENGFHYAFSELFNLYQRQNEQRRQAGPDSPLWYITPLAEQKEKVDNIAKHLSEAEAASRRLDAHTVFSSYLALGVAFQDSPDDLWLAEHFFQSALEAAGQVTGDDNLKLAMAHWHYGLTLETEGFLDKASVSLKEFYRLTRDKLWKTENGELLHRLASAFLVENYRKRVDACPEEYHSDRINLCVKAFNIALEADNWPIEARIRLRLGQLLEDAGQLEKSLTVFQEYFEKSCEHGDYQNLGTACEALAKLYQKLNNVQESIKYLQQFANSCERHGQWSNLGRACQLLGAAYDTVGDYASALKWMRKAYTLPNMIQGLKQSEYGDWAEMARIMIGVTRAHLMHQVYVKNIVINTRPAIYRVTSWKASPKDEHKLFNAEELQPPIITFANRSPRRDVLRYARNPATGFLN